MIAAALTGIVAGLALGLRFKVLVLLPAQMAAILVASVLFAAGRISGEGAVYGFFAFSLGIQFGYAFMVATPIMMRGSAIAASGEA